ncbi:MAG TPA: penicillin-binding protein, partial [Epsilonproteobacteria bacterium]|nr:penicillin-binding protein [Campylobacterota bacterium]
YRMKSLGWITQEMYLKAVKESPEVYRTSLTQNKAPFIVDEVLRRFNGRLGDIRTGGYKIYTTIDMDQQRIAGEAVDFAYQQALEKFNEQEGNTTLNAAFVSVESATGNILSMIGGESYERSSFNRVTQVERQPGSAFKPFIYQTALDMGYNPATPLTDISRSFQYTYKGKPKIWAPKNYEKNFKGFMPLREALVHSRNLATVNLVVDLKVSTIRKRLKFLDVPHIPRDMSIALGNLGVSPLKMAQIFSVFANNGHMIEPRLVSKIISKEGAVIYETRPKEIADFTTPEQAYLMTDILKDVVKRGTGRRARVEGIELAGKTGTTNNSVDAWFCGYSPTIETIVWFGRDDNTPIGKRGATGGGLAAPAFSYYYRELLQLYPDMKTTFDIPDGVMRGYYKDKEEIYTVNSPLPAEERKHEFIDFERRPSDVNGTGEDFYTMDSMEMEVINYGYEDIVEDDINREGQLTAEDLILLEEEKNPGLSQEEQKEKKRDKALHPERKVPQTTVSDDSGALF